MLVVEKGIDWPSFTSSQSTFYKTYILPLLDKLHSINNPFLKSQCERYIKFSHEGIKKWEEMVISKAPPE